MKERQSRRDFMGFTGAGMAGLVGGSLIGSSSAAVAAAAPETSDPDAIVINAKVYTVDDKLPRAEAFAVKDGKFTAIGATADIKGLAGKNTQVYDAKGMTVVPGFIDCHNHAGGTTLLYEVLVGNPFQVEFVTIDSIVEKLKAKAAKTPPGTWVEGYFFDDTKVKDKRQLNRQDLDRASTEHPIVVRHRGGHTSFYNTKALEMAGITKATKDMPGGTYDKDANGELNGRVTDQARAVFSKVGKQPEYTAAQKDQRERDGIAHISKEFVRQGLTTVHHEGGSLEAMQFVRAAGNLKHRISYEPQQPVIEAMISAGIQSGFGDDWIRFGATSEHSLDGSFSERTMALNDPYPGTNPPYSGNITSTQKDADEWVERTHRAGIRINCHANGEVAIHMMMTSMEKALQKFPNPKARPKITHCTLINEDLVKRMKAMDAVPALFTTYAYYNTDKFSFYGETLMKRCMAFRTLIDAGIKAAAGSDFSPGPFAPLMGIQGMVTRTGWDGTSWGLNQRISIDEAIKVNTLWGAYNALEENTKGSITVGKLADFVVLAEDPHAIDVNKIKDIQIVRTVVGGSVSYQA